MYTIVLIDNGNRIFKCTDRRIHKAITKMYGFVMSKYIQGR